MGKEFVATGSGHFGDEHFEKSVCGFGLWFYAVWVLFIYELLQIQTLNVYYIKSKPNPI